MAKRNISIKPLPYLSTKGGTIKGGNINMDAFNSARAHVEYDFTNYTDNPLVTGAACGTSVHLKDRTTSQESNVGLAGALVLYEDKDYISYLYYAGDYKECAITIDVSNYNVGIGVNNMIPQHRLHVVGDIYCTGRIITDGGIQDNSQSTDE